MTHRMIQVGTGGFGAEWCRRFLPPNVEDGWVEVVAAVDTNPAVLFNAREGLDLTETQCFTDVRRAFDEHAEKADFCTIVVPPAHHEAIVDEALAHGLNVLSEKPIADSLEASCRIAKKVKSAGKKMGVTMSHRFRRDVTTLRGLVRSSEAGETDYLVCRFTCAMRKFGEWGAFRHRIPDTLMVEGAVHHLDLLADMGGAKCETIYAETWKPRWGEYAGDCQGLVTMHLENGKRCLYEGAKSNAMGLNCWNAEYIRAECENATFVMTQGGIERFAHDPERRHTRAREGEGEEVALLDRPKWANAWLIEQFCRWLDGDEPMETNVEANLQSVALIFAAIESRRTRQPVKVQEFLAETMANA